MKILVRAPNWIGDQILAYPFFFALRKMHPHARITVICVEWVQDIQFRHLVDEVVVLPRMQGTGIWAKFVGLEKASGKLKSAGPWDLAITLPNSFSSAWVQYRAGGITRRGYRTDGRSFLLNSGMDWPETGFPHRAQAYLDLVPGGNKLDFSATGFWGVPPENDLDPPLPGEEGGFDARKAWPGFVPTLPPKESYWVLAPGATADSRRWPVESFVRLAQKIWEQTRYPGLIVGGPKEAPLAGELRKAAQKLGVALEDWTALGPVPSLSEIFRSAKFTVSNESGLAHVASLCGSFVQIVCGAADPRRTRPIGPGRVQVTINPVECWPCERNVCAQPVGDYLRCLRGIYPEVVWEEIKRGLRLG